MPTSARAVFARALDINPDEREAFLAAECGDDAKLRLEVQRLLADAEKAQSYFSDDEGATIGAGAFGDTFTEAEGDQIGPYKLRQRIGEGGFGTVWMAEQSEPISRMVALKVIKAGMDTRQVLARFEAERQALAMMDHPNIAKVLDAGATNTGRPYFAMELVKGIPITEFCDGKGLSTRERLVLFGDVCSAINHAHQKGIIHRDIKPSNVMVTLHGDKPVVKVIDFGIAKATQGKLTDHTLFTRFEQFVGTPVYMSPEQAAMSGLDIDTRSDIYALGVLLYELLTGQTPFDGKSLLSAGYDEMRRIIREEEPPKPSSRLSTVAGDERTRIAKAHRIDAAKLSRLVETDLDWIVMKAIEKDRSRRYETANAFAQDIVRFLADEPVTANPPSKRYQLRKFAKRNKATFRVAALIFLLLVAATAVSSWQAVRATQAEKETAETLAEVAAQRDAKEKALSEAEAVTTFLTETFQSPDPALDGRTITVAQTLDTAAKKLETELADQPARRAKLRATLGITYFSLGLYPQAIELLEMVRDYHLTASGPEHPSTLTVMSNLPSCYYGVGHRHEALKLQEEVLALCRKVLGTEHPGTLRAMDHLATFYFDTGRREDGIKMHEEALRLFRKVLGPEDPSTLQAMGNLAGSYFDAGRRDQALEMHDEALALSRKVLGAEHPDTLRGMNNLANSYADVGRRDEALEMRDEVLALSRKVLGPKHSVTLTAMSNLASSYSGTGRRDEALEMRDEVLALSCDVRGPEHPDTLRAMSNLASSYSELGRGDEALKLREKVLQLFRSVLGLEDLSTLDAMKRLALSYFAAGCGDDGFKLGEELLALYRKVLGSEHPDTLEEMNILANFYHFAGLLDEALKLREELLAHHREVLGPEHPDTLKEMNRLANLYSDADRLDEALKLREEALPLSRKVHGPEHPNTGEVAAQLGFLLDKMGAEKNDNDKKTIKAWQEAVRINPKNANVQYWLGGLLVRQNRLEEAVVALRAASALYPASPRGIEMQERLVKALNDLGREEEAKEVGRELAAFPGAVSKHSPLVQVVIVTPSSEWKWLHPTDGTDPAEGDPDFHSTFFASDFAAASWQTGKDSAEAGGGFGYGDDWFTGVDIGTPASKEVGKCAYFRHRFTTTREHTRLEFRCQRDDGIIIYLDGKEVARDNMEKGEEAYHLPAASAVSTVNETTTYRIPLEGLTLPAGEHLLAISLHNLKDPSSDLRIGGITLVEVEEHPGFP
ncbi:MAG: tetratricopeptide repeat protein [Verrucomicrobiales bacterium]